MRPRNISTVFKKVSPKDFTIIILAAGEAEPIRVFGTSRSLIPIGESDLVNRQISTLSKKYPGAEIIVVLGHDANRVYRAIPRGVRVIINERWAETTATHSLDLALKATSTPNAVIISGDIYFDENALILPEKSTLTISPMKKDKVGVMCEGIVSHLSYGLSDKWGQISYVIGNDLDKIRGCVDEKILLYELINKTIRCGARYDVVRKDVVEINIYKDLEGLC